MIHSCIEAHIEDCFPVVVDIQQPCCCNPVSIWEDACCCRIDIENSEMGCHIENPFDCSVTIEDTSVITIMLEWVCGTGYAEHYLHVTPEDVQWITVEYDLEYYVRSNTDWIVH